MKILIAYATYSGSTSQAAQIVTDTLTTSGHTATLKTIAEIAPDELSSYDIIVFGSPSWDYEGKDGYPHGDFMTFINKVGDSRLEKKFAIFGLGDQSYQHFCGAVDILETFVTKIGGTLVQPSLRINGFYFDNEGNTQKIKEWAQKLSA